MASMMPLTCLAVKADRDENAAFEEFMDSEFPMLYESKKEKNKRKFTQGGSY